MSQLKKSFILEIEDALNESIFTKDDFELTFPKSGKILAKIEFVYNPDYRLILSEEEHKESITTKSQLTLQNQVSTTTHKEYALTEAPGSYKSESREELYDIGETTRRIPMWCINIKEDLKALASKTDPLDELRKKFQSDVENIIQNPEENFSEEEIAKISQRFDDMLSDFSSLKDELELSKRQIETLKAQFDEFKQNTSLYPKGIWAKITANKLAQAIGKLVNTPEIRKLLFDQAKKYFSGSDA